MPAPTRPSQQASIPHYYALLTPLLHRRFVRVCWITLVACYIEAFVINDKTTFFWSLFPISLSGFKVLWLFGAMLPVLILRVGQLNVIPKSAPSYAQSFMKFIVSYDLVKTLWTYAFSSWLFIQLYIWAFNVGGDLSVVSRNKSYEKYRLNERYLYLTFYSFHLGAIYAISHLALDRDWLKLLNPNKGLEQTLRATWVHGAILVGFHTIISTLTAPLVYGLFRGTVWSMGVNTIGIFFRLQNHQAVFGFPVTFGLFLRSVWLSLLVCTIWEISNIAFTHYFSLEPVNNGTTVSERSTDPNGSLMLGLKTTKKPLTQSMAFMELSYITKNSPARRISMFKDLRAPKSIWTQIVEECLGNISAISAAVGAAMNPPPTSTPQAHAQSAPPPSKGTAAEATFSTVKEDNIWQTPPKKHLVDQWQAPADKMPISPISLDTITQNIGGKEKIEQATNAYVYPLLKSAIGSFFRITIQDKTRLVFPNVRMQIDSINALTKLCVASLVEDEYGSVQKDIPIILSYICTAMTSLEAYRDKPPVHWTDVEYDQNKVLSLYEPDQLLAALSQSIAEIGNAFAPYFKDMGLSVGIHRRIKECKSKS